MYDELDAAISAYARCYSRDGHLVGDGYAAEERRSELLAAYNEAWHEAVVAYRNDPTSGRWSDLQYLYDKMGACPEDREDMPLRRH